MSKKPKVTTPLPADVINDIIDNRFITNAREVLSKKHGISHQRVYRIWHNAYGGGTIECAKNCKDIKRPKMPEPLPENELIEHQTPRGKYKAPKPKVQPDARANPRVVKKPIKYGNAGSADPSELDLDNIKVGDLPAKVLNQQANIIAGQVQAGNNNADLLEAIKELLRSQQDMLSRATVNNLVAAQQSAAKSDPTPSDLSADPDLEQKNAFHANEKSVSDSIQLDDSTQQNKIKRSKNVDDSTKFDNIADESTYETDFDEASSNESEESYEYGGVYATNSQGHASNYRQPHPATHTNFSQSGLSRPEYSRSSRNATKHTEILHQHMGVDSGLRVQPARSQARAKPISKISKRPVEPEWEEESGYYGENSGYEQEIYPPQQNPVQRSVQSHNARYNYQHGPRPVSSPALTRQGRNGFGAPQQIQSRTIVRPY